MNLNLRMSSFFLVALLSVNGGVAIQDGFAQAVTSENGQEGQSNPAPDWDALGPYFKKVFPLYKKAGAPAYLTSPERHADLTAQYKSFSNQSQENSRQVCMPVSEAFSISREFNQNPDSLKSVGLSPEQMVHVRIVGDMTTDPVGDIVISAAIKNNTLLCVDNEINVAGRYRSSLNVAMYELKNICDNFDWTESVLEDPAHYTRIYHTVNEELIHAAQYTEWGLFTSPGGTDYTRPDEKIWQLSVEAHAKLIAAGILVRQAHQSKPEFLEYFLQSDYRRKPMVKLASKIYTEDKSSFYIQNLNSMADVFEIFFRTVKSMDAYQAQDRTSINKTHSTQEIPIKSYTKSFGTLPGVKGNMLEGRYKRLSDVATLIPKESDLAIWFKESFEALAQGKPQPDLPENKNSYSREKACAKNGIVLEASLTQ